ncbi:MAG: DUF1295 domain-containing protein [Clostridia bacterium]|nr:DUF1295 domain-containing protein [Clostridia bacterium]
MLKGKRGLSFLVVALVYLFSILVGLWVYYLLYPLVNLYLAIFLADVGATALCFVFSVLFNNASVYDPYWSVQPIVILSLLATSVEMSLFKWLLLVVVILWGVRLTANWAYTFYDLTYQDWRYTMLKEQTKKFYPIINFVGIHLVPTIVVYLVVTPGISALTSTQEANPLAYIGLVISLGAIVLQGVADTQMHKYRKTKKTPFIRNGVWKHSRHPNYLAEILMWWGIGIACTIAVPTAWYLLLGALANTLLFAFVSIPMAEKRQGKKEGFEEYKKATNYLLPFKIKR